MRAAGVGIGWVGTTCWGIPGCGGMGRGGIPGCGGMGRGGIPGCGGIPWGGGGGAGRGGTMPGCGGMGGTPPPMGGRGGGIGGELGTRGGGGGGLWGLVIGRLVRGLGMDQVFSVCHCSWKRRAIISVMLKLDGTEKPTGARPPQNQEYSERSLPVGSPY